MRVPAAIAVHLADCAGIAVVVGVLLLAIVISSTSASTPPSSASTISSLLPHLSRSVCAAALRRGAVLCIPKGGPIVCVVHPAGSLLLLSLASLVAFGIFAHLMLSAIWLPLRLGHYFCVKAERALLRHVPHNVALVSAAAVWPWAVVAYWYAAAHPLYVASSTAMLTCAVRAYICDQFDWVQLSRHLDAFSDHFARHLIPLHYKDNWQCWVLPTISPLPDSVRVCQPLHLDGDHHSFILSMDVVPHLLPALCGFAHVPYEWHCINFQPFWSMVFFNSDVSVVDCMGCSYDNDVLYQRHHRHCVLVGNRCKCTHRVSFHVDDLNMAGGLLVEKCLIDCRCNFPVNLFRLWFTVLYPQYWAWFCHARPSSHWCGALADWPHLTLCSAWNCLTPSGRSGLLLRFGFVLPFKLLFEWQFGFGFWLLLPLVLLWISILHSTCMQWGPYASAVLSCSHIALFPPHFLGLCCFTYSGLCQHHHGHVCNAHPPFYVVFVATIQLRLPTLQSFFHAEPLDRLTGHMCYKHSGHSVDNLVQLRHLPYLLFHWSLHSTPAVGRSAH